MEQSENITKQGMLMLVATTIASTSHFLFQLIIGRMLGPTEYSVLTAVLSLFVIISVPTQTIQTVISKYSSTFMAKKHINKISYLFFRSFKKLTIYGSIIFIIFFFIASPVAQFLNIDSIAPIIALGSVVAVSIVTPAGRGLLLGLLQDCLGSQRRETHTKKARPDSCQQRALLLPEKSSSLGYALKLFPHPHVVFAFGFTCCTLYTIAVSRW